MIRFTTTQVLEIRNNRLIQQPGPRITMVKLTTDGVEGTIKLGPKAAGQVIGDDELSLFGILMGLKNMIDECAIHQEVDPRGIR